MWQNGRQIAGAATRGASRAPPPTTLNRRAHTVRPYDARTAKCRPYENGRLIAGTTIIGGTNMQNKAVKLSLAAVALLILAAVGVILFLVGRGATSGC